MKAGTVIIAVPSGLRRFRYVLERIDWIRKMLEGIQR